MPFLLTTGVAVAHIQDAGNGAQYVSWTDLARRAGCPSQAHEAEHSQKAYWRERAQRTILEAFNRQAAA